MVYTLKRYLVASFSGTFLIYSKNVEGVILSEDQSSTNALCVSTK